MDTTAAGAGHPTTEFADRIVRASDDDIGLPLAPSDSGPGSLSRRLMPGEWAECARMLEDSSIAPLGATTSLDPLTVVRAQRAQLPRDDDRPDYPGNPRG